MSRSEGDDARGTNVDEKKRKRMISNRESARRSRMKKQKHMRDLVTEVASLKVEIHDNTKKCEVLMQKSVALESENDALKVRQMELGRYLRNLEVMQNHMELLQFNLMNDNRSGGSLGDRIVDDINEPPKVESWKCHGSNQTAIMASSKMLNY